MSEAQPPSHSVDLLANHVEQTVLPKWVPYWTQNDVEPFEVEASGGDTPMVSVGPVENRWLADHLHHDLIRSLPSGRYFSPAPDHDDDEDVYYAYVKPQTPPSDEEIRRGLAWPRGEVIEALHPLPYSPKVIDTVPALSKDVVRVHPFETNAVAKYLRRLLQRSLESVSYHDSQVSVQEFTEKRGWLGPDTWYAVDVLFEGR